MVSDGAGENWLCFIVEFHSGPNNEIIMQFATSDYIGEKCFLRHTMQTFEKNVIIEIDARWEVYNNINVHNT